MKSALGKKLLLPYKPRIWEIDFVRGICIVLMIFDHMMFDFLGVQFYSTNFKYVQNSFFHSVSLFAVDYWYGALRLIVRNIVVFLFLFMSGISCSLTKSNTGRLRKLAIGAGLITAVTFTIDFFFDMGLSIAFGILHIIAFSLLIFVLLKKPFPNPYFYLCLGAVIVIVGLFLPVETGGTQPFWMVGSTYPRDVVDFLDWDGFIKVLRGTHLYGSDSYGVFPYVGFFLMGAAFGEIVYRKRRSLLPRLDGAWNNAYSFIGRHGILIYLAHQVVVFALVYSAAMLTGYNFF